MVPTPAWGVKPHIAGDAALWGEQFPVNRPYSDGRTFPAAVTTLLILLCIVLGALAIALAVALVRGLRRSERQAEERVSAVVSTLEQRMDELAVELAGAVERAEEEGRRSRYLGEIAGSIDLDDVVARTLEAAAAVTEADAALICLEARGDGPPLVAGHGLASDGAQPITGPPDGSTAQAVFVSYSYAEEAPGQVLTGLGLPLLDSGRLSVYSRTPGKAFGAEAATRLAALVERATPALENAQEFREARQLADLDALTGLHNRRYFHELLARECARAHRYQRRLALIVFDIDDFKDVNDRIGHLAGDAVLAEAAERMRTVVRSADVPCRVGGDEFAVVMPESGIEQAEQLFTRLQTAINGRAIGQAGKLQISAGVAELKAEDDSISFFERADQALYRAKDAGKNRAFTADGHAAA
jgi:diguanylate cyclase (GGDEF)-like protein